MAAFLDCDDDRCHFCGGDGFIILDFDNCDDPINMCDWKSGGEVGDTVKCTCCGGSGKMEDCMWI